MASWQLQEAKARFSELVRRAVSEGPQEITVHGEQTAILLSAADYERLSATKPTLLELLRSAQLDEPLMVERNRDTTMRTVEL